MRTFLGGTLAVLARLFEAITGAGGAPRPAAAPAALAARRHRVPRGALVLAAVGVATLALPLLGVVTASAASPSATEVIHADVLPDITGGPARLIPVGMPPAGEILTIGVGLMLPDLATARTYYHAEYTVGSAAYHKFLTPAEFASRFGVNPSTCRAVLAWLKHGGLRVTDTAAARDRVEATGSVAQIEALMQVQIARYQVKGVGFLTNTRAPTAGPGTASIPWWGSTPSSTSPRRHWDRRRMRPSPPCPSPPTAPPPRLRAPRAAGQQRAQPVPGWS